MRNQHDIEAFEQAWQATHRASRTSGISHFDARRSALNPFQVAALDPVFRSRARRQPPIYPEQNRVNRVLFKRAAVRSVNWAELFEDDPAYALLAMHAPDGRLREIAVNAAPLCDTAALVLMLVRCNDWAKPVRDAARRRIVEVLATMDKAALIPMCLFVQNRASKWGRGGAQAAQDFMAHPEWRLAVVTMLMTSTTGPLTQTLRDLLRDKTYDAALPELAKGAQSAFVRAVAVSSLLTGYARWIEGYEWQWHDKVFGLRKKVARFGKRKINLPQDVRNQIFGVASIDPSPKVRALAADYLIDVGPSSDFEASITLLNADSAASVQDRMMYFSRKWQQRDTEL